MNIKKILKFAYIASAILLLLAISSSPLRDPDMFFHIKNGEHIMFNGFSQYDIYSIHSGLKYVEHEWASQIIFYNIFKISGFLSLWVFKILMCLITFGVLFYTVEAFTNKNKILSFISSFITMIIVINSITIRPLIFSYIFFILEFFILEKYDQTKSTKYLYFLPIISVLIINFHGATIPLLFVILAVYFISSLFSFDYERITTDVKFNKENVVYARNLFIFSIASCAAIFINPNTYKTIVYSFKLFTNSEMLSNISEFSPAVINTLPGLMVYGIFFMIVITLLFTKNNITIKQFLFLFGSFIMALSSIRYLNFLAIFTAIFYSQYINSLLNTKFIETSETSQILYQIFKSKKFKIVSIILPLSISITFLFFTFKFKSLDISLYPQGAVNILKSQSNLRLLNDYSIGHFLIFNGIKVSIDGRAEMYTPSFNNVNILKEHANAYSGLAYYKNIIAKYNINHVLINKNTPLAVSLSNDKSFVKAFEDKNYVLYSLK